MRVVWKVNLYHVSNKTGYRVKLEGCPNPGKPWVMASADGATPWEALQEAIDSMAKSDQASVEALLYGQKVS